LADFLTAFLRHAEYFKGIIFLTTNLGRSIDPAVISRAQIHLRFPALTRPLRVRVWENFVGGSRWGQRQWDRDA
jgi:hypothetical protein